MEHNYARVLDLQLNAKIKHFETNKHSINEENSTIRTSIHESIKNTKIPMMSRTGGFPH